MDRSTFQRHFPWLLPTVLLAGAGVAVWPALQVLLNRWQKFDESYSHGFLVLVVCVVLSVRKWRMLRPVNGFYPAWLFPLALAAAVYLAGSVLFVEAFQQIAMVPLFLGLLLLIWGWKQASAFFLPVGLLIFAIPVWDYLSWPLQLITVAVNQLLLSALGIDFTVEGVFVYFPGVGAFEIAHGCSGLRYLLVGLTISTIYAELSYQRLTERVILLVVGALLAMVANWIRVFVIIYVGYESNMTSSLIWEHDYFGWWVFAGTLVPLFVLARYLEHRQEQRPASSDGRVLPGNNGGMKSWFSLVPALAFVTLAWAVESSTAEADFTGSDRHGFELLPSEQWLPLFRGSLGGWQPVIQQPDLESTGVFVERDELEPGQAQPEYYVGLFTYNQQRPGSEVVQYANRLYDADLLLPQQTFTVPAGSDITLTGLALKYRQSESRVYLAYGYYVESFWQADELRAKLAQLPGIFNNRSDASLLVIGVRCDACDEKASLERLAPVVRERIENRLDERFGTAGTN